jgi:GT2 family glycosyltransferase
VAFCVVSLGDHGRARTCLSALIGHESQTAFHVIWVINASEVEAPPAAPEAPDGVVVVPLATNLGWSGGLHVARAHALGRFLVWVQDDVFLEDGWLDAMIEASNDNPDIGVLGSIVCNGAGVPTGAQGGYTPPGLPVDRWNDTDTTLEALPTTVAARAWVTSGGLFTRLSVWDEVGGPDPGLWPLNHVDKDYCTHVRAHGHGVALVPGARARHDRNSTGAMPLRRFVAPRYGEILDRRWSAAIAHMGPVEPKAVEHDCSPWREEGLAGAVHIAQAMATRLFVPYVKWSEEWYAARQAAALAEQEKALAERYSGHLAAMTRTVSWRVTAPLRAVRRVFRRR